MSESLGVPVAVELPCPMCGKPTPNLKSYRLGTFFFLVLAAASRTRIVTACPSCMREQVFTFAATNVVTFNVFWPFFILPLSIAYLIGSLRPGHSKGVIENLRG